MEVDSVGVARQLTSGRKVDFRKRLGYRCSMLPCYVLATLGKLLNAFCCYHAARRRR